MRGWLVVNSFIHSQKSKNMIGFFGNAAKRQGIKLEVKNTTELIFPLENCEKTDSELPYPLPDFVIFWDKDVYTARRLEEIGLPVFNSAKAILLCDNKNYTSHALAGKVPTPKTITVPKTFESVGYTSFEFLDKAAEILGLPFVIKEAYGSFGQQVYLARTIDEAIDIFKNTGGKDCQIQQFISESYGRDVRINVVGGRVVASMLRTNDSDFRSNITNGGKSADYTPTAEQADIAVRACAALGLSFGGVDILFGQDTPIVCEVNSNPHFISTFDCTGIDVSEHIMRHVIATVKSK